MIVKHKGFISFLNNQNNSIIIVNCIVHRDNLVAKNMSLNLCETLELFIKVMDKIKANSKYDSFLKLFVKTMDNNI